MTPDLESLAPRSPDAGWRGLATDAARCLRFYSRLPAPALPWERDPHAAPDFAVVPRALPLAGAAIGAVGALALALALALGFPPLLAAALAVAALALATGALHEDGLADTVDGFWGGNEPARRLEIMRDSRIGSYGGAALVLSLIVRVAALAAIVERAGPWGGVAALVALGALSRTAALDPLARLDPARPSGAARAVGRPLPGTLALAWALSACIALPAVLLGLLPGPGLALAFGTAALVGLGLSRLAQRRIGGHTGDVVGATQQAAEIAALLALLASLRP